MGSARVARTWFSRRIDALPAGEGLRARAILPVPTLEVRKTPAQAAACARVRGVVDHALDHPRFALDHPNSRQRRPGAQKPKSAIGLLRHAHDLGRNTPGPSIFSPQKFPGIATSGGSRTVRCGVTQRRAGSAS
jgi:hypothetical protein